MLSPQLSCDSGKGENIVILIHELVRRKFLVTYTDGIMLAIPYEQVACKGRLNIVFHDACRKAAVCGLDVSIPVIDPDHIKVFVFSHDVFPP